MAARVLGPALDCSAIVYRAIRKSWFDPETRQISEVAFMLRAVDTDGLSVSIAALCTPAEACAVLMRAAGVASLHTGRIREADRQLDVLTDPDDVKHALVTGLPMPAHDKLRSEFLAGRLRDQSRFIQSAPR